MEKIVQEVVFGLGGSCYPCDSSHDHPLNNIIEVIYYEEGEYDGS
jgi:hypothetical protein